MHYYLQRGEQIRRLDELEFEIIKQTQPLRLEHSLEPKNNTKVYSFNNSIILETEYDCDWLFKIR